MCYLNVFALLYCMAYDLLKETTYSMYCIALAEHGINKTLEVFSTEVMSHIRQNKDDFYSSFQSVSESENESKNLIECLQRSCLQH